MSRQLLRLLLFMLVAFTATAATRSPGKLVVERNIRGDLVVARLQASGIVDADLRERIRSGLTNRLVVDVKLVPQGMAPPVFTVQRSIEVVYDLWDEHYLVKFEGAGPTVVLQKKNLDQVVDLLAQAFDVELGAVSACQDNHAYRVDVTLTINPVSQKVRDRSREMTAPGPDERGSSGSRSLFGSVARVFFNVSTDPGVRTLRALTPFAPMPRKGQQQ